MDPLPANVSLAILPKPSLGRLTGVASHQLLLPALLQRERADLFHSPGFVAAFSVPGIPWRCPQPLVLTLHDFIPLHVPELFNDKAINRWWYGRQSRLARRAAKLICVSEARVRTRCAPFVGSTSYNPETYGERLLDLAQRLLRGEPVPPAVYVRHTVVTKQNVDQLYPEQSHA